MGKYVAWSLKLQNKLKFDQKLEVPTLKSGQLKTMYAKRQI